MGRYRTYRTESALRRGVEGYFAGISRVERVTEEVNTGRLDKYGHFVKELREAKNEAGEPVLERKYYVPPTVGGLCAHLGISRETWSRYCDREENPQFAEITQWAREMLLEWREKELLRRGGKHIRGLLFDLQANYGLSEKRTVELGPQAARAVTEGRALTLEEREALLREIAEEFGGHSPNAGGEAPYGEGPES